MGLFDRLFGRKKQEPPIEEVVKEALENIDDLGEETAPAPEAGENLEAEAAQSYQGEQQLDDQISDTKDSLADVEEPAVTWPKENSIHPSSGSISLAIFPSILQLLEQPAGLGARSILSLSLSKQSLI